MLTDGLVLRTIQETDKAVNNEVNQLDWTAFERFKTSQDVDLNFWHNNFIRLNEMLDYLKKKLSKNYVDHKIIHIDYNYLLYISERIDKLNESKELIDPEKRKIIKIISSCSTKLIFVFCYYSIIANTVLRLIELKENKYYFETVLSSNSNKSIYLLQNSIPNSFKFVQSFILTTWAGLKNETQREKNFRLQHIKKALYPTLRWRKILTFRSNQFIGIPNTVVTSIKLPFWSLEQNLEQSVQFSNSIINTYSLNLNRLFHDFDVNSRANLYNFLSDISVGCLKDDETSIHRIVLATKNFLQGKCPTSAVNLHNIQKPSFLTRYWPLILISTTLGPKLIQKFWFNRFNVIKFCKENVWDFAKGLFENWLWLPIKNIWSTVKHDDDSEISVVSKGSLQTEKDSLSRMIIQYMEDNKNLLKKSNIKFDLDKLTQQIKHGQLDQFMAIYEKQIDKPLQNLLTGKLLRSILIQIQKTKVDGSLALNGIDKMLKSQQLVFEVMALSPSLLICFTIFTSLQRLIKLGNIFSNIAKTKRQLKVTIREVELMINELEDKPMSSSNNMLVIEISNMYSLGRLILPKWQHPYWFNDCLELLVNEKKQNILNRIYHIYGNSF